MRREGERERRREGSKEKSDEQHGLQKNHHQSSKEEIETVVDFVSVLA